MFQYCLLRTRWETVCKPNATPLSVVLYLLYVSSMLLRNRRETDGKPNATPFGNSVVYNTTLKSRRSSAYFSRYTTGTFKMANKRVYGDGRAEIVYCKSFDNICFSFLFYFGRFTTIVAPCLCFVSNLLEFCKLLYSLF